MLHFNFGKCNIDYRLLFTLSLRHLEWKVHRGPAKDVVNSLPRQKAIGGCFTENQPPSHLLPLGVAWGVGHPLKIRI